MLFHYPNFYRKTQVTHLLYIKTKQAGVFMTDMDALKPGSFEAYQAEIRQILQLIRLSLF